MSSEVKERQKIEIILNDFFVLVFTGFIYKSEILIFVPALCED